MDPLETFAQQYVRRHDASPLEVSQEATAAQLDQVASERFGDEESSVMPEDEQDEKADAPADKPADHRPVSAVEDIGEEAEPVSAVEDVEDVAVPQESIEDQYETVDAVDAVEEFGAGAEPAIMASDAGEPADLVESVSDMGDEAEPSMPVSEQYESALPAFQAEDRGYVEQTIQTPRESKVDIIPSGLPEAARDLMSQPVDFGQHGYGAQFIDSPGQLPPIPDFGQHLSTMQETDGLLSNLTNMSVFSDRKRDQ